MRLFCLIAGSLLTLVMILMMLAGRKYEYMLEPLDKEAFPLKSIYIIGLALQGRRKNGTLNELVNSLRADTKLYYPSRFDEFYARIIVAQIISVGMLSLCLGFSLGGLLGGEIGGFFAILGFLLCVISGYYFKTVTKSKINDRCAKCEADFPDAISKLALMVNSGVIIHDAWKLTADGDEGVFYDLMKQSCLDMENGQSDIEGIRSFGIMTNSEEIKKFCTALIQNIERGGGELPVFLVNQSAEIWNLKRQKMLQKGEKAAGALLIPITLMFGGIMLIVIASAIQSLSF